MTNAKRTTYHHPCRHGKYHLSCEQFDELFIAARGACQICRRTGHETNSGVLFIDHDNAISYRAVRGLLCVRCNGMLGMTFFWRSLAEIRAIRTYLANPWHARLGPLEPEPIPVVIMSNDKARTQLDSLVMEIRGENPPSPRRYETRQLTGDCRGRMTEAVRSAAVSGVTRKEISEILVGIWDMPRVTLALTHHGRILADGGRTHEQLCRDALTQEKSIMAKTA